MAIIRTKRKNKYTTIDNCVFADNQLSFQAIGMLTYLLSKPDNWNVHPKVLEKVTEGTAKKSGRDAIYAIIGELISAGFVVRRKQQSGEVDYFIFDEPQSVKVDIREDVTWETRNTDNPKYGKPVIGKTRNRDNPDVLIITDNYKEELIKENNTFVDADDFADETEISDGMIADKTVVAEIRPLADEKEVAQALPLVGAEAPTTTPKPVDRKSKTTTADNRKRFAAIAEVFNAVFADCPAVQKVNLAKVTLENGKTVDTKTNLNRMKLVPYAWGIARQRVQAWADADGLIDGEQPSGKHCLQWFENYFRNCRNEGFINGSQPRSATHENWKPKFENLLKPEWIEQRVFEGD